MNIYTCWYRGNLGYGCRRGSKTWMFVPEFGQNDNHIYSDLSLEDLIFKNPADKRFERQLDDKSGSTVLLELIQAVFNSRNKAQGVTGGLLSRY